ncbi:UDP-N-acetylglucosamine--N-acetylmuramyl-(pentapeptide) pyrophosphoryl-undecaprenol N-acetylglucosamine transferase [Candidatus Uhrbacteria bacterium]|nr:UDP-N-acetylglucosamine--N-acetylmuramyl-(pentapeptide) pyrophosphoryl-undecaprenol N-acetylglucosamine transferase [Candidatus Uhrbacteria bacterium]
MVIVLAGGGTLGPVTPLLAVAEELKKLRPDAAFHWVGTETGPEREIVAAAGMPFSTIRSGKLRRYFSWQNFLDNARLLLGVGDALLLLGRLRPAVVVSAGGFVAVPVAWAAALLRIPIHVHQLDLRPGLANKLAAPFARSISVGFEELAGVFGRKKAIWTGNPVRAGILAGTKEEGRRLFGLSADAPVVLILGGGTGSGLINSLVAGSLQRLTARAQVLHVTGRGKAEGLPEPSKRYRRTELLGPEIAHAFAAADIVVTRAGMGTLSEIAALGKPAVIIPIADSHQEENAAYFCRRGAARCLAEKELTPDTFAAAIEQLAANPGAKDTLGAKARQLAKDGAARAVAELVLAAAERR